MRMQNDLVTECKICSRPKHSCAWEYKLSGNPLARKVAGGACYSCVRACHLLPITREVSCLQEVAGVLDVVKSVNASVAEDLKTDAHACSASATGSDDQISATAMTLKCQVWGDAAQRTAWQPGLRTMPKRCQPDGATLTKHTWPRQLVTARHISRHCKQRHHPMCRLVWYRPWILWWTPCGGPVPFYM